MLFDTFITFLVFIHSVSSKRNGKYAKIFEEAHYRDDDFHYRRFSILQSFKHKFLWKSKLPHYLKDFGIHF